MVFLMEITGLVMLAMLLTGPAVVWYKLWVYPYREFKKRLHQTMAWKQQAQRKELEAQEAKELKERKRRIEAVARQMEYRAIDAFTELGLRYHYRSDEVRNKKRQRIQKVIFPDRIIGVDFVVYPIKLPQNVWPTKVLADETQDNLRIKMRRPDLQVIRTAYDGLFLHVPLRGAHAGIPDVFTWHSSRTTKNALDLLPSHSPRAFPVGLAANRQFVYSDITQDGNGPHIIVAGAAGGGKSVFVNNLICSIVARNSPAEVGFYMIDLKLVELIHYEGIPHLREKVVTEPERVAILLEELHTTMKQRQATFATVGARKLSEWNKLRPDAVMPYLFVVFDEMAEIMLNRSIAKDVEGLLARLCALGRALGIHFVFCTQRPSVDVVTGLIKANAPERLAFSCPSAIDSQTILGNGMAVDLETVGRAVYMHRGYTSLQTPYIEPHHIAAVVEKAKGADLPPTRLTDVQLFQLMLEHKTRTRPELHHIAREIDPLLTIGELSQMLWQSHYSLERRDPVLKIDSKNYILWGSQLLPIKRKGPKKLEEIIELEVLNA